MSITPTLTTERLLLRGWRESDFAPVAQFYVNDPDSVFVGGPRAERDTVMWFMARAGQWAMRGYGAFVIEERASGAFVGWCGVNHHVDMREPEVQYALFSAQRGRGYMCEAGRAAFDFLFKVTGREKLRATIHPKNTTSQKTARRLNGAPDGKTVVDDAETVAVWWFLPVGGHA